jgi:predicted RNA-binding Zn-ribbon protein involved in translation (DUF1610 family)
MVTAKKERCANCDREIGRLETAHLHGNDVVCAECSGRLAAPATAGQAAPSCRCPKCGSSDTARLQTIHEQGTTTSIDDLMFGLTSGQTISDAAQRAAPPRRQSDSAAMAIAICCVLAGLVLPVLIVSSDTYSTRAVPPLTGRFEVAAIILAFAIAIFAVTVSTIRKVRRWNSTIYPPLYTTWLRRWMCRRCGEIFTP